MTNIDGEKSLCLRGPPLPLTHQTLLETMKLAMLGETKAQLNRI